MEIGPEIFKATPNLIYKRIPQMSLDKDGVVEQHNSFHFLANHDLNNMDLVSIEINIAQMMTFPKGLSL